MFKKSIIFISSFIIFISTSLYSFSFTSLPIWSQSIDTNSSPLIENYLNLESESAILIEESTGQILYEKSSRFGIASNFQWALPTISFPTAFSAQGQRRSKDNFRGVPLRSHRVRWRQRPRNPWRIPWCGSSRYNGNLPYTVQIQGSNGEDPQAYKNQIQ